MGISVILSFLRLLKGNMNSAAAESVHHENTGSRYVEDNRLVGYRPILNASQTTGPMNAVWGSGSYVRQAAVFFVRRGRL